MNDCFDDTRSIIERYMDLYFRLLYKYYYYVTLYIKTTVMFKDNALKNINSLAILCNLN